jgi:glycosyltransferase involved in cell wall biosynthesis
VDWGIARARDLYCDAVRILIATHYWRPHRGGIETVAFEQARRLVARNHVVTVLTSRLQGDAATQVEEGIEVRRIRAANLLEARGVPFPIFAPSLWLEMMRLVRAHDLVLAHSHLFLTSAAAVTAAHTVGKPSLVLQHNTYIEYSWPWSLLEDAADQSLGRWVLTMTDRRLAVSDAAARYVEQIAPGPTSVVRNGVDTRRFRPTRGLQEREALRAGLDLEPRSFVVFTVRRLSFKNGVDTLLEAALQLRDVRDLRIVIAGAGPDRAAVERFVARHRLTSVRVLGFVPDDELVDWYRASDLFILPSKSGEGMPMVVLEAFASALPVVATRTGGQVEMIEEGDNGWLIPPADPAAMAAAIASAFEHLEKTREMGRRARSQVESLDWDRQVTLLESHLNEHLMDA